MGAALDEGPFFHGTKADLKVGDLIEPGYASNYGKRKQAAFVYLTATMDALERATNGDKDMRIFLRADKVVSYGDLMEVMNLLRAAGYFKVALVGLEKVATP